MRPECGTRDYDDLGPKYDLTHLKGGVRGKYYQRSDSSHESGAAWETSVEEWRELLVHYPIEWESEYRDTGTVAQWHRDYPHLFPPGSLITRLGTLDLFAQYALQYNLRQRDGAESLTWYKLASTSPSATNRERTDRHWKTMREKMGDAEFEVLQKAIIAAGLKNFDGEPDLFCWKPADGSWFFAEAKRADTLEVKQRKWFGVCRQVLGVRADIRVYRLRPARESRVLAGTDR